MAGAGGRDVAPRPTPRRDDERKRHAVTEGQHNYGEEDTEELDNAEDDVYPSRGAAAGGPSHSPTEGEILDEEVTTLRNQ